MECCKVRSCETDFRKYHGTQFSNQKVSFLHGAISKHRSECVDGEGQADFQREVWIGFDIKGHRVAAI